MGALDLDLYAHVAPASQPHRRPLWSTTLVAGVGTVVQREAFSKLMAAASGWGRAGRVTLRGLPCASLYAQLLPPAQEQAHDVSHVCLNSKLHQMMLDQQHCLMI